MSGRFTHAVMVIATAASLMVSPVYAQDQQAAAPAAQTDQTPGVLPPPPQYQPPPTDQGPPPAPTRNLGLGTSKNYSKPNSWFPNLIAPYTPIKVSKPELTNSPRINQLIQEGKLMLSLEDAVSLGLENNLSITSHGWTRPACCTPSREPMGGSSSTPPLPAPWRLSKMTRLSTIRFSPASQRRSLLPWRLRTT